MAAAVVQQAATSLTTNAATYNSGAFTPPAGSLLLVIVATSGQGTITTESVTSNTGLTFTKIPGLVATQATALRRITAYIANAVTTAVSTTLTYTGNLAFTGGFVEVAAITGISRIGTDAVRQFGIGNSIASNTVGNMVMPAPALTTNPIVTCVNSDTGSGTPAVVGTGWIQLTALTYGSPSSTHSAHYRNDGWTSDTVQATSYNAPRCALCIEIDSSTGVPPTLADLTVTEEADTLAADGSVTETLYPPLNANLAKIEGGDAVSSAGVVFWVARTANLAKTEVADTLVSVASVNPLLETFKEDFELPLDTAKWTPYATGGSVTFEGGTSVQAITSAVDGNQATIISKGTYNFLESSLFWKFVQPIRVSGDLSGVQNGMGVRTPTGGRTIQWFLDTTGALQAVKQDNFNITVLATVEPSYYTNPFPFTWLRVREKAGITYWDSAPDTASNPPVEGDWVNRHSVATSTIAGPWNNCQVNIYTYMGTMTAGVPLQPLKIDAVNTATAALIPLTANLAIIETADSLVANGSVVDTWLPLTADLSKTEGGDTVSSDGTVFWVSRTANLAKTELADTLSASIVNPLIETFTEDFEAPIDTAKWNAVTAGATLEFTGGTAFENITSAVIGNQAALISKQTYRLIESSLFFRFVQPIRLTGNVGGIETGIGVKTPTGGRTIQWALDTDGALKAVKQDNFVTTVLAIVEPAYYSNPLPYSWLRIHEKAGVVYFDSAVDTASNPPLENEWINRHSVATSTIAGPWNNCLVNAYIYMHTASGVPTQPLKFDGLNIATAPISGFVVADLEKTELADSLVSDVDVITGAALSKTELPDSIASNVNVTVTANLARTEGADTLTANDTDVTVSASLSKIEGADTLVSDGIVVSFETINCNLTVTEVGDSLLATASAEDQPTIYANLTKTEVGDSLQANDTDVIVSANLARTEGADALSATVYTKIEANLSKIESPDVLTANDTDVKIVANLAKIEGADTLVANTGVIVTANLAVTETGDTLQASLGTPTAIGLVFEYSPDALVNPGAFSMRTTATRTYLNVKGTAPVVESDYASITTTEPQVLTSLIDLGGPSVISRTNGVQTDMDVAPLGGMMGKYKFYFGAGAGNKEPFQGRMYQFIARGKFSNAAQVADIENYVAMKTGAEMPAVTTVEVRPGVIRRVNRRPRWYQFEIPPWIMMVLVSICISSLLAGCAIAVNDEEMEVRMEEVIKYLTTVPFI